MKITEREVMNITDNLQYKMLKGPSERQIFAHSHHAKSQSLAL